MESLVNLAFQPGETVVLWGTGLGPISGSDILLPEQRCRRSAW